MASHGAMEVELVTDTAKPCWNLKGLIVVRPRQGAVKRFVQDGVDGVLVITSPFWQPGDGGLVGLPEFFHDANQFKRANDFLQADDNLSEVVGRLHPAESFVDLFQ